MAPLKKALQFGLEAVNDLAAKKGGKVAARVNQYALPRTERKAAKAVEDVAEEGGYDPYSVAKPTPAPVAQSSIIRPTADDVARVTRPPQERSGIFDYDYKMPNRPSGVERYDPPKGVPERTTDLLSRPDVYDKMVSGVQAGLDVKDWYEMGPAYKSFIDEFGPEEGNMRFDAFMDAIAATSPRSDVGTNIRNATYYYGEAMPPRRPGQNFFPSFDDLPEKPRFPYGHLAQDLHRMNAGKVLYPGGGGFDPFKNPKPLSFSWNFKGDPNLVTVDTHAFRAPAMHGQDPRFLETSFKSEKGAVPRNIMQEHANGQISMDELTKWGPGWQSVPKQNEYGAWENYYRRIAQELGITPAEAQAAGWVGNGRLTGLESAPKSAMDFVEERILKTARERGMDPADVWREAIRGIRPLTKVDDKIIGDMPGASAVG